MWNIRNIEPEKNANFRKVTIDRVTRNCERDFNG